jgi:hypothetical protein
MCQILSILVRFIWPISTKFRKKDLPSFVDIGPIFNVTDFDQIS